MDVKQIIRDYDIPKTTIAQLSGCNPWDVSRFLQSPEFVTPVKAERITQAVADVQYAVDYLLVLQTENGMPPSRPDLKNVPSLKFLITHFRKTDELKKVEAQAEADTRKMLAGADQDALIF